MQKTLLILVSHASFFISHRFDLAIGAQKAGYKVKVIFGEIDIDVKILKKNKIEYFFIPIDRGGINIFKEFQSVYFIWKLLKFIKPDILHLVTIKPYLYGGINLIVFLAMSYFTYWLYQNLTIRNVEDSKVSQFLFSGPEWEPILKASSILEQLDGYEANSNR